MAKLNRLALLVIIVGCDRPAGPVSFKQSREIMGTFAAVTAVAVDQETACGAVEAAYARLSDVNCLMSDYVADSEIGCLNKLAAGESLTVSPETFLCLQQAIDISERSGGAFDPTCRPLIALWKQAGKQGQLPNEAELATVQQRIGWGKLRLDAETHAVTLLAENMQVDLGGIAKGYALDLAAEAMRKSGASGGLVDVGGDIVAFGKREDGTPWRIGVRHPFQNGLFTKLELADAAVATSGVQQRFYEIAGRRYSHIIDPRSGRPAEQAPSVTVIAADGLTADAWATVLSVLTIAEGRVLLRSPNAPAIEVMWIAGTADSAVIDKTSGFDHYLVE